MILDWILVLVFVAICLRVLYPTILSQIEGLNRIIPLIISVFLVSFYSLVLIYLIFTEPFSLTFILFAVAGFLIFLLIKKSSARLFFRYGLVFLIFMIATAALKVNFLAEFFAATAFVFLLFGLFSLFYHQDYES